MPDQPSPHDSGCSAYLFVLIVFGLTAVLSTLLYPLSDLYLFR